MGIFFLLIVMVFFLALVLAFTLFYFVIKKRNSQSKQNRKQNREFLRPDLPNNVRPDKSPNAEIRRQKRLANHQEIDARLRQKHRLVDEVIGIDRITNDNPQYEWPSVPDNDKKTNGW